MWNAKKSNVSNARGSPRDMLMLISQGSDKIAIAPSPGLTTWANSPRSPGGMGTFGIDWCITESVSHAYTKVFTPHLFHPPTPSLHQCLLEQLKHTVGKDRCFQHNSIFLIYLDVSFHDLYAFQHPFYVFLHANGYKNNSKKRSLLIWSQTRYHCATESTRRKSG